MAKTKLQSTHHLHRGMPGERDTRRSGYPSRFQPQLNGSEWPRLANVHMDRNVARANAIQHADRGISAATVALKRPCALSASRQPYPLW